MKKYERIISVSLIAVLACMFLLSCSTGTGGGGENKPAARIGSKKIVSVGSQTLTMIYANDSEDVVFPTGINDSGQATLAHKFWMGEAEVSNAVIAEVLQWALEHDRFSTTVGNHNGLSSETVKYGGQKLLNLDASYCKVAYDVSGQFFVLAGYEEHPVVGVTWYGMVMVCNWLSEMRDGDTDNIVYTGIDTTWDFNETIDDPVKTGYRLPLGDEWEYSARYRGDDPTNTVSGYSDPFYTKGDSASGATSNFRDTDSCLAVAVFPLMSDRPVEAAVVKSLGQNSANALGFYDMSGNVYELCCSFFEINGKRYWHARGGNWRNSAQELRIGYSNSAESDYESDGLSFRLCYTVN